MAVRRAGHVIFGGVWRPPRPSGRTAEGVTNKTELRSRRMASKGTIAILTGGGDVPGLNPAIRAITIRALREGYRVVGLRRGWAGLVDYVREKDADNSDNVQILSEAIVNRAGRTGGTFLHTSRTRPSHLPRERVPRHLSGYEEKTNDITRDILKNLEHIGVDILIP